MKNRHQKMSKEQIERKKYLIFYLMSFIPLIISCIFFCFAFCFESVKIYYLLTLIFLILFCIPYYIYNKKISCNDGYNLVQAYFFFLKCEKNEAQLKSEKVKISHQEILQKTALEYEFSKNFDDLQNKKIYKLGYEVSRYFK